jgi:hypothetical protein
MKLKTLFLFGSLFLASCGYELPKTAENANNSRNSASQNDRNANNQSAEIKTEINKEGAASNSKSEIGGDEKLILNGTGETASYPCNGREVEIGEEATANVYTLTGECKKLTVGGVSNKITVERVGEIVARGISNKVTYGEGIGGKQPKISKSGPSTSVESKKAQEEKKQAEDKQA